MDINNLKIDVKNLEIGKVYPSFDEGIIAPERLCFIKIKEKTSDGYIVDVKWGRDVIATNVGMVYINKYSLKTIGLYGGIITNNICKDIQRDVFDRGYRINNGVVVMQVK